jgi:hypothetical protein
MKIFPLTIYLLLFSFKPFIQILPSDSKKAIVGISIVHCSVCLSPSANIGYYGFHSYQMSIAFENTGLSLIPKENASVQ